ASVLGPLGVPVPLVRKRLPGQLRLHQHLDPGVYFLALRSHDRSRGRYSLELSLRVLTTTDLTVSSAREVDTSYGVWQQLVAVVRPAGGGLVRLQLERFAPLSGWQAAGSLMAAVRGDGVAAASWLPPSMGEWRVAARFLGTKETSPSRSESVGVSVGI